MIEIPLSTSPKQSLSLNLDGREITLKVRYSDLVDVWSFDLYERTDSVETPLVLGVRLVMGIDLLAQYGLGLGSVRCYAASSPGQSPSREDLGNRVRLIYATAAEVEALQS